jgi:hypothetical protein
MTSMSSAMSSSVGWLTENCPSSMPLSSAQVVIRWVAGTGSVLTTSTRLPSIMRLSDGTAGTSPSDHPGR